MPACLRAAATGTRVHAEGLAAAWHACTLVAPRRAFPPAGGQRHACTRAGGWPQHACTHAAPRRARPPARGQQHTCICTQGGAAPAHTHACGPEAGMPACVHARLWAAACVRACRWPAAACTQAGGPKAGIRRACLPACAQQHACMQGPQGGPPSLLPLPACMHAGGPTAACMHAGGPEAGLPARRRVAACTLACKGVAPACMPACGPKAGPPACLRAAAHVHVRAGGGGTCMHARRWPRGRPARLRVCLPVCSSMRACMQVAGGSTRAGRRPQGRHACPHVGSAHACMRGGRQQHACVQVAPRRVSRPPVGSSMHTCMQGGGTVPLQWHPDRHAMRGCHLGGVDRGTRRVRVGRQSFPHAHRPRHGGVGGHAASTGAEEVHQALGPGLTR